MSCSGTGASIRMSRSLPLLLVLILEAQTLQASRCFGPFASASTGLGGSLFHSPIRLRKRFSTGNPQPWRDLRCHCPDAGRASPEWLWVQKVCELDGVGGGAFEL